MSHSHLPIQHLLKSLELHAARRARRAVPDWLSEFIHRAAELFEPFSRTARAGFECQPAEDRWEVLMYLGSTEMVGGSDDGAVRPVNFQFDLAGVFHMFDSVESFQWCALPDGHVALDGLLTGESSFVTVTGSVQGQKVSMQIQTAPPPELAPAMRRYSDGRMTPV